MKTLKVSLQIIISVCVSLFTIISSIAQTTIEVSGDITENTIWEDDTLKVTGDITVLDDITLTINPETYIKFTDLNQIFDFMKEN